MSAEASAYYPMVGTVSASVDPIFSIDPSVPNASSYTVLVSPGITEAAGPANFYTVTPCRVIDTRRPVDPYGGPALASAGTRIFIVTGQCGIPSGATAIAVNIAATQPTSGPGFVTLFPAGTVRPTTSTLNYSAGQTRANNAVVPLGASGDIAVFCTQGGGTMQFILDVTGYFK